MLRSGERQVATRLEDIRADHRARYEWAAKMLPANSTVLDLGCGIGYGAHILAEAGHFVLAVDIDEETIVFAGEHYSHRHITYVCGPAEDTIGKFDAVVCFEMVEHVEDPVPMLERLRKMTDRLLVSVPNEEVFPYRNYKFHFRHYTRAEFGELLLQTGFIPDTWWGQEGPESPVAPDVNGRTLVVDAIGGAAADLRAPFRANATWLASLETEGKFRAKTATAAPRHVVIVGLGPSAEQYMDLCKRLGGRKRFADEVWAINALGDVLACDRVFHMDDVRVQELRAEAAPQSNIAEMVKWLKAHPGPVITSRAHPDYPGLVEFPLEDVINNLGYAYFNGTAAYAVAYAIHIGVEKISLFGCDFTYANAHDAEKGRACVEFWIGFAAARGIELGFADRTSLMDTVEDAPEGEINVYGYDFDKVLVAVTDGAAKISFEPRDPPPTAAEIEARYDHSAHPNPLVAGAKPKGA